MKRHNGKLLVVLMEGCFIKQKRGSHIRIFEQLKYLSMRHDNIVVYSYDNHPEHPWSEEEILDFRRQFPEIELYLDRLTSLVFAATRVKNLLFQISPAIAGRLINISVPGTRNWKRLKKAGESIYIFHFIDMLSLINGLPSGDIVVETHDIKSIKFAKLMNLPTFALRVVGKIRSEAAMLSRARAFVAISPVDLTFLRQICPSRESFYIPSYASERARSRFIGKTSFDLLFVGARNKFNADGICDFIDKNSELFREIKLAIVGAVCTDDAVVAVAARHQNIVLLGPVADIEPVYNSCKAVVSPVEGTGLKIKVVEALSYGRPVFGSPHSIEGLPPGWHGAVFDCNAETILKIINDEEALEQASISALRYFETLNRAGDKESFDNYIKHISSR